MKRIAIVVIPLLALFVSPAWSSEIHLAVESGNLEEVRNLLDESPGLIEDRDENQTTPLLAAVTAGNREIVESLLDRGADMTATNSRGSNVLHLAAYAGHTQLVECFLKKGVDINSATPAGFTPLLFAIYKGHTEVVKLLVSNGADMDLHDNNWGGSAMHWSCNAGNDETRRFLLESGEDLYKRSPVDSSTPVFWAAHVGNNEALEFLFENGVSGHATTPDGWTPLHNAARQGHLETCRLLLQNGAEPEASNQYGTTPLIVAIENGRDSVVNLLFDFGVDVNQADSSGLTLLHYAVMRDQNDLTQLLIEKGADVNAVDEFQTTPICRTVYGGNIELAKILIEHGADVNIIEDDNDTPLRQAVVQGQNEMAGLFLEHEATLDLKDSHRGQTELHLAAIRGNKTAVELLLSGGADINATDFADRTPLYYARKYGHTDVADLLKANGGRAEDYKENSGRSELLNQTLRPGEAVVWYLGHCGYAIKTSRHLLIFDYWNVGSEPGSPGLVNGWINPSEIADENVFVFVTHEHQDHYDTSIFDWPETVEKINYVYGFRPEELPENSESGYTGPDYVYIGPRMQQSLGDMEISTIAANDAGVGFLVSVDGLKIYHAGDHAGWAEDARDGYIDEIDYLAETVSEIDFAFLNVTGCHAHDTLALAEGTLYTLSKLNPQCWFPTHGINNEYAYTSFADKMTEAGAISEALCPENRGDAFIYRPKDIQ